MGGDGSSGAAAPGHRPPPPRSMLEGVRNHDPEAMGDFYEYYFDRVFGLVLRLLGNRAAAEDVTQEVFFKVNRSAHQLDLARDPGPWLTAIAYNACRDLWRSSAHRMSDKSSSIDDEAVAAPLASTANDPEGEVLAHERERLVRKALAELPEQLRTPVLLYDYQGMSHQEIATLLGIEHAAARKRYSRALTALARLLKDTLG